MKRRVLIILLAVVFCLSLVMVVACDQAHTCESKCSDCGLCTNKDCKEDACKDKCQGHVAPPTHTCGHVCPTCNKCTDLTCNNSVCADKCPSHGTETVKVTKINITGYDVEGNDDNNGTLAAPFVVSVAQGHDVDLGANVQPTNATDKTFNVTVGKIENNAFAATPEVTGLTATVNTRITLAAAADLAVGGGIAVEVKAKDGSNVAIYLNIVVKEYVSVTQITSSALKASEEEGIDYELQTAVGTNWAIGDITSRGQDLLDGKVFGGKQAPRNLTYYANVHNLGINVVPANASEPDYTITYSEQGIVEVAVDGALTVKKAGETIITITSDSNSDVAIKIKVTVQDVLYRGILLSAYENATAQTVSSWDLDPSNENKGTAAHDAAYDAWNLVMVHSNLGIGQSGDDNNQKIFYMGNGEKPYGVSLENNVGSNSGGSLLDAASLMWAKLTIPQSAITFNVKLNNNNKTHGQYRVLFVDAETKVVTVLTTSDDNGWCGFASSEMPAFTIKLAVPEDLKGHAGAMVIEHRVTEVNNNAELHIYKLGFEGQVDVTGVEYNAASIEYLVGQDRVVTNYIAKVKPDNATNDKVTYAMHDDDKDKGVTVDANTGAITIAANAAAGTYRVVATSVADNTKTATFTLTLTADEIEVNEWKDKNELLNGVSDVKWTIVNGYNSGAGEGIDLSTRLDSGAGKDYSAAKLANRKINATSFIMAMSIRTFPNEKTQEIVFKLIDSEGNAVIIPTISGEKAIADNDPAHDGKIDTYYYDLSAYIGGTYDIELGVTGECYHAVITSVKFTGSETKITNWANKSDLLNKDGDPWAVEGQWNSGAGEGIDLQGAGSYTYNKFVIGAYNAKFSFTGRVFTDQYGDKGIPTVKLVVVSGGQEVVVRAIGESSDEVQINIDDPGKQFSYDLSAFIGKEVEIRIVCVREVHHCVVMSAKLEQQEIVKAEPEAKIGDTEYETLAEALAAAQANDTIVLQKDVKIETTLVITKKITLDLNGKTISSDNKIWGTAQAGADQNNWSLISVQAGGDLTITGNGKVIAKEGGLDQETASCYAVDVRAADAKLTIENGEFVGNRTCIYVRLGSAEIKGGKYSIYAGSTNEANGHKFVLNLKDNVAEATLSVTGGQFVNYDPSNAASEAPAGHFVPETGYTVTSAADGDNTIYTVAAAE